MYFKSTIEEEINVLHKNVHHGFISVSKLVQGRQSSLSTTFWTGYLHWFIVFVVVLIYYCNCSVEINTS